MLDGWLVIFTGPKLIDELRRSPDEELSADEGVAEVSRRALTGARGLTCEPVPDAHSCPSVIGPTTAAHARPWRR